MTDLDTLRYPIGRFVRPAPPLDRSARNALLDTLEQAPARFRSLAGSLSDAALDTSYRPADGPFVKSCITCPTVT